MSDKTLQIEKQIRLLLCKQGTDYLTRTDLYRGLLRLYDLYNATAFQLCRKDPKNVMLDAVPNLKKSFLRIIHDQKKEASLIYRLRIQLKRMMYSWKKIK